MPGVAHRTLAILRRRLFTMLAAISLVLCLAIVALYVRAFTARDEIHTSVFRHHCIIATFPHHVHVILANHPAGGSYPTSLTRGLDQYPARGNYLQPRMSNTGAYWGVSIPFWLPLMFAASIPMWIAGRALRRRKRIGAGLCPICGYDLRATPDRCPECGQPISATEITENTEKS